jgi:hypothetical protein
MRLPLQFAAKDDLSRQGDVEFGFMSCTPHKKVALDYAAGGKMPMLLSFERGATNNGGSRYWGCGACRGYSADAGRCPG